MVLVSLREFLGVLDWPVPPMPQASPHAHLGEVKQYHEEFYFKVKLRELQTESWCNGTQKKRAIPSIWVDFPSNSCQTV